ncbi:hypothetical protein EJ02DRAFT_385752 [Clathrospora elynae]|uniref:Subtilisin-like serine protease n=1 Tax=Clathrospora elynae TaxID=706981 RepID=A0A6A5SCF5_9PLEO|nr:hypothetical protein EJ02DRAFT_385752 [Clathrospora elynae]
MKDFAPFTSNPPHSVSAQPSTKPNGPTRNEPTAASTPVALDINITPISLLLAASYRTTDNLLHVPDTGAECLKYELGVDRLNDIHSWLWTAGRPMPPRELHHQKLLGREIVVTERMDMHLVWCKTRIFVKPLPRFLLESRFWTDHLSCKEECNCLLGSPHGSGNDAECAEAQLKKCALGFLMSYAALISHESDFFIAQEAHLLSDQTSWMHWKVFVKEILEHDSIYDRVNKRYIYGELRLNRLNTVYRLTGRAVFRGYQSEYNQYSSFFQENFTWLASVLAYMVIVLTAMQVGLATRALEGNEAFQTASYGFTVFAIVGSLAVVMILFIVFLVLFIYNWIKTVRYVNARRLELQQRDGNSAAL